MLNYLSENIKTFFDNGDKYKAVQKKENEMIEKSYSEKGDQCFVTFTIPDEWNAQAAVLVGEFNEWNPGASKMTRTEKNGLGITMTLETGKTYRFRYLLDEMRWENDPQSDGYMSNVFGTEDSIVIV